jgi:hypothetical protein
MHTFHAAETCCVCAVCCAPTSALLAAAKQHIELHATCMQILVDVSFGHMEVVVTVFFKSIPCDGDSSAAAVQVVQGLVCYPNSAGVDVSASCEVSADNTALVGHVT